MAQHTDGKLRGIGVVLSRWGLSYVDDQLSAWSEADPYPGTARTDATRPRLSPQLLGAQSQTIELPVIASGVPKAGGRGLQVGWRLEDEGAAKIRGFTAASTIADVRMWGLGDGVANYASSDSQTDAAWFPLSGRVACYSGGHATNLPSLAVWSPHSDDFENAQSLSATTYPSPTVAVVPGTERLLILCSTSAWMSDDYGATLQKIADRGYADASTGTPTYSATNNRVRSAWDGAGNLLIVAQDTSASPRTDFYTSSDQGVSFDEVARVDPTGAVRLRWDITSHPSGAIFFAYYDSNAAGIYIKRLGGAYQDPDAVAALTVDAAATPSSVHLACDENGTLWLYAVDAYPPAGDPNEVSVYFSTDEGETWTETFEVDRAMLTPYTGDTWASARFVPCAYGGICGPVAPGYDDGTAITGATDGRTAFMRLGGWTAPDRDSPGNWTAADAVVWWASRKEPEKGGTFTSTSSGGSSAVTFVDGSIAGVSTAPFGYWRIDSGIFVPGTQYYTRTLTSSANKPAAAEWVCRVEDDGGGTATAVADVMVVRLQSQHLGDSERRTIAIRMDEAGYRVWDEEAGAWLGDKVLVALTTATAFRVSMTASGVETQHMQLEDYVAGDTTPINRTDWTYTLWSAPSTAATASNGTTVRWGIVTATASAAISFWLFRARASHADLVQGFSVTGVGLAGWTYPVPGGHDPVRERVCRLTVRGYGTAAELYSVAPKYGYPMRALFPGEEPSPDVPWRSVGKASEVRIACTLNDDDTAVFGTLPEGEVALAVVVRKANVRNVKVIGYAPPASNPASYTTLGTLDLATGFSEDRGIEFTRAAGQDWISPTGSNVGARRLRAGEARDGFAVLDPLGVHGSLPGPHYLKIRDNSAGWWDASKGQRARLFLEGLDNAIHPTSGALAIVMPSGVFFVARDPATFTAQSRIGIAITNGADGGCPDDNWQIGSVAVCAVVFPGKQWGHGRVVTHTPNVGSDVDDYGTERRSRRGPAGRTWEVSWDHGAMQTRVRSGDEWLSPATSSVSTLAVAGRDDVSWQLWDLLTTSNDGERAVLLLAWDTTGDSTEITDTGGTRKQGTITDTSLFLFGHLASDLRTVIATGNDGDDEYELSGPLVVREVV